MILKEVETVCGKLVFGEVVKDDIDEILKIENMVFRSPWSLEMFKVEIDNEFSFIFGGKINATIICYASFWIVAGETHITNLAVIPDYHRMGFGTLMLEFILKKSLDNGARFAVLEVRESNTKAINLYRKFGFKVLTQIKRYYADNGETALIMGKMLSEKSVQNTTV